MVRKLRVQYEGAIYHVIIRGVEWRSIFEDEKERERAKALTDHQRVASRKRMDSEMGRKWIRMRLHTEQRLCTIYT